MSDNDTSRDWRASAYLRLENWPEAIPETGPKREYGPYPWNRGKEDRTIDGEPYPWFHADAASVGQTFFSEVCPRCGVPIDATQEQVVTLDGREGTVLELTPDGDSEPVLHPDCYAERKAESNYTLGQFQ